MARNRDSILERRHMPEQKTLPTRASVAKFIAAVPDDVRRRDCRQLMKVMKAATAKSPVMWGPSMVGYGSYHYKYASGHEGDCFLAGFAPRKAALTVYLMAGFAGAGPLLKKLGRHKRSGGSCLYIRRLEDIDLEVLGKIIRKSVASVKARVAAAASA
jgi:hypothetical protein